MTATTAEAPRYATALWLALSLAFAAYYASQAMQQAFSGPYVAQDDARQHVFWMQRFIDHDLFPRDLIADYFQSVAPIGYASLYRAMAWAGLDPFRLNKILPLMLGLVTTAYCFGACLKILPVPAAGFIAALLLNQSLWMSDDMVSATPRAFLYPLFLAFVYYLLRRSLTSCLIAIALQALFYPSTIFISAGVLASRLLRWERGPRLSKERGDYIFFAAGLIVAACAVAPFALKTSGYGPVITVSEARALPEFHAGGRTAFFEGDFQTFWLTGRRSGMFPELFEPLFLYAGLLLPVVMIYSRRLALAEKISAGVRVLLDVTLASFGMFFAAHLFLFKFHLPSRYTQHSLRVALAIAASLTIAVTLDSALRWADERSEARIKWRQFVAVALVMLLAVSLVEYPRFTSRFMETRYRTGEAPSLYEFFAQQPKDILIASLAQEANNLPSFAQRSILVGREYAIPYHVGYYSQIRQRAIDLIEAQYSADLNALDGFIKKYGVDFFVIDRDAFQPEYLSGNRWLKQFQPAASEAIVSLKQGSVPALAKLIDRCSVFETDTLVVIPADCVLKAAQQ